MFPKSESDSESDRLSVGEEEAQSLEDAGGLERVVVEEQALSDYEAKYRARRAIVVRDLEAEERASLKSIDANLMHHYPPMFTGERLRGYFDPVVDTLPEVEYAPRLKEDFVQLRIARPIRERDSNAKGKRGRYSRGFTINADKSYWLPEYLAGLHAKAVLLNVKTGRTFVLRGLTGRQKEWD